MPVTRTRISDDYIKDTCPTSCGATTTRTRISGDYIKPCGVSWCEPICNPYPRTYVQVDPCYRPPVVVRPFSCDPGAEICIGLLVAVVVIAAIGSAILSPTNCHIEEVCQGILCHKERVCVW